MKHKTPRHCTPITPTQSRERATRRRAAAMMMALVVLLVVGLISGLALQAILQSHRHTREEQQRVQAELLADAALSRAQAMLRKDTAWQGESWSVNLASSPAEIDIAPTAAQDLKSTGLAETHVDKVAGESSHLRISVTAIYPSDPVHRAQARREVTYTVSPRGGKP